MQSFRLRGRIEQSLWAPAPGANINDANFLAPMPMPKIAGAGLHVCMCVCALITRVYGEDDTCQYVFDLITVANGRIRKTHLTLNTLSPRSLKPPLVRCLRARRPTDAFDAVSVLVGNLSTYNFSNTLTY